MANKVRVTLIKSGVRELLRSDEMKAICESHAHAIRGRCGEGYAVTSHTGKSRVNASVIASTPTAKRDNIKNNTILKATK